MEFIFLSMKQFHSLLYDRRAINYSHDWPHLAAESQADVGGYVRVACFSVCVFFYSLLLIVSEFSSSRERLDHRRIRFTIILRTCCCRIRLMPYSSL